MYYLKNKLGSSFKPHLSATLFFIVAFVIQFNTFSQCPSNVTFSKLNWNASPPFQAFTPTTFTCTDGLQQVWKMPEASIGTGGEIEGFPGFQMQIPSGLDPASTSILVSINGVPYSYYGNIAPANVLDWGALTTAFDVIEPYIAGGSTVTIEICDTRVAAQTIPYTIFDHATGVTLTSGTATPSNGNCQTITFSTISSPTMVWDIDGDNSKITNNNNGSATFDPTTLTVGTHTINYSFNNNNGCTLTASQSITITCPSPVCPTDLTFTKVDWTLAPNSPFVAFSPTTFTCTDGIQKIWKNVESNINTNGNIQTSPGFNANFTGLSPARTSILVSVNGVPYSYYGNNPPANVINWGSLIANFDMIEPYIPNGATVTLQICDTRAAVQNIPYTVYDHFAGTSIKSGTVSVSNGVGCQTITFTIGSPTITWNIDGNAADITNNNDGSASFDPSALSVGAHTINYSYTNNSGCTLTATQNITITCPTPPVCSAAIGTFNVTGATANGGAYDIADGATVGITNSNAVMPTGGHQLSYAFFSCAPSLPLSPSQLLDLRTVPCYLGSDNGASTSDVNNSGFSQTFSTLNKVYVLPYTRFNAIAPLDPNTAIVNDGTGCYALGSVIELNYITPPKVCPTDLTFTKVDWTLAPNSPFVAFSPTTFTCTDGIQKIWKNVESNINTNGNIQTSAGFNANFTGLSPARTSILVSVNGVPYSYYGNNPPANVINWGALIANFDMIEPYIPNGATVTLQICDTRAAVQNIPYTIFDYLTGTSLTSGTVSVSNAGGCQTVTFTVGSPTLTWNIDGVATDITNNNDGSASFDPSTLSVGSHTINYTYDNNNGCTLSASQNITITCPAPPVCTAAIGTFNVTGATLNGSAYDIADGATVGIANSNAVMPTGGHQLSYAFFSCAPSLPLSPSQLLDLRTVPCYLGSDNGTSTSDINNAGFSQTFSTLSKVYVLPYTRFNAIAPLDPSTAIVNDGTGCYAIGNVIELNYSAPPKVCPTDLTFTKIDWTLAPNSPFVAFSPTSFNCTDGIQKIWKNAESSIITNGEIQTSSGFNMNLTGLSPTQSSILVSVNGVPYSYYGNSAPTNVINWGPLLTNFDMIEPYIPNGATVTLQICDARVAVQNIPYSVFDHVTGGTLTSGSVSVSNGSCQTVTFTLLAPTLTWDIDGNAAKITNNNDGSASFDPSGLSAGSHTINYTYNNNNGCTLTASQSITINALTLPNASNEAICSGAVATLTGSGASTYNWYNAASAGNKVGSLSVYTTPALTVPTSYWVSSGSGLCESARVKVDVTIKPDVAPTFNAIPAICQDAVAPLLQNPSNDSKTGTWNPSIINTTNSGTVPYVFTPAAGQCASVKTINVTINPKVTPVFNLTNDICVNSTPQLLPLVSDNAIPGTWGPSSIVTNSVGTSTYQFTPSAGQCATSVSKTINVIAKPVANATPSVVTGNPILNVDFTNTSTNATALNWDFGNGSTSTDNGNTSTSYSTPGSYTVTLIASNNVCPDSTWTQVIIVKPIDPLVVVIPNIFTPNNDGVNDEYFLDVKNAETFEAAIFNRWGNEMITLNHSTDKWSGKLSSGDQADEGTYFVKYKIVGFDKTIKEGITFFHLGL